MEAKGVLGRTNTCDGSEVLDLGFFARSGAQDKDSYLEVQGAAARSGEVVQGWGEVV